MNNNNLKIIEKFLNTDENNTLIINQVNEEIGQFYDLVVKEFSKKIGVKVFTSVDNNISNTSSDLFGDKKIYLFNLSNSKQIENVAGSNNQKIIFTDYKNFKKFHKKYLTVNGYNFEKDIRFFLKFYFEIDDINLINFSISHPYFIMSEISKYSINKISYRIDQSINSDNSSISQIRKKIFKLKVSDINIKKLFLMHKDEVLYKKFNFLIY